ncbi:hypothetical protein Tco_0769897 [Tanacetum coccineum]|uniref:Uncharacterized protein n=1 Tax=Tanacetum coccineum TaxID=301880 RepID=A0ABQ4ZBY1_9ASTR
MTRSTIKRLTKPLNEPEREFRRLRRAACHLQQNESLAIAGRNLFDDKASSSKNTGVNLPTPPRTLHERSHPNSSGSHEADECKKPNLAEQVCLSRGDIYDDPSLLRYGYCKYHKKTVKTGQTRTRERIECTRDGRMLSREFYNSIMRDKVEYKGKNVVGAFMNVPIFVGNFSIVTHFAIVDNMDGYRDQDMGDIILGEPFCKASCVEARKFDGLITIHNGSDNVTYQMARSHPRFKHLSNTQCNKIKPLLKVSLHDKLNGILHPYQKLKSFYK